MDYLWDATAASALDDGLAQLIYLSNLVGADAALTQPGGGNSSLKRVENDVAGRAVDVLRVKGSGTDLRTVGRRGFTGLRVDMLAHLRGHEAMSDEAMMSFMRACMLDPTEPAPSVETPLHSVLPFRFIVHTHDFATQALTDTESPSSLVTDALEGEVAYVDYVRPGFPLARQVSDYGPMPSGARGLVLGRHGLIAWGDSAKECYDNLHRLIGRAEDFVAARAKKTVFAASTSAAGADSRRRAARAALPALRASLGRRRGVVLHYDESPDAIAFASSPAAAALTPRGMSTPEHILRCGKTPLHLGVDLTGAAEGDVARTIDEAVARYESEYRAGFERHRPAAEMLDPLPKVVLLPGVGLVTATRDKASSVVANLCYRHVMRVIDAAESLGGFRFLDEADALEFEYWPLELAKANQPERELSRQVALITGAASGIGAAIAERFAAEGAHVVLTDVAGASLRATAERVAASCRDPRRVVTFEADAASAADTAAAVDYAVFAFGGVDILVCNAGYLEAGPIDKISEDAWRRHFDVNVLGNFLAVREVVGQMKARRRGSIVFNASKGAFAPTSDNAAYASSKAAVAAFARNLATELGPHGVRVNYVNADFIDTPLMHALIEQRAALRGVSAERQTTDYRARNLLGVGPIPADAVADAVLYLASPRAAFTTGAVLTVDGGIREAMPR